MAVQNVFREILKSPSTHERPGLGEKLVDHRGIEPDDFEKLSALVARERRDAHLRHDFFQARFQARAIMAKRLGYGHFSEFSASRQVRDNLQGEIRVDGAPAVTQEAGKLVRLPDLGRFEHQVGFAAHTLLDQFLDDGARGHKHRHGRLLGAHASVA